METKTETNITAPDHYTLLNRIRQKVLDLMDNGRLAPQELQIIFELEIQIQKRLHELREQENSLKHVDTTQENDRTVVDDSPFPQSDDNRSEPIPLSSLILTTPAHPHPQSTFPFPQRIRFNQHQTSHSHQPTMQHIQANQQNIMHHSIHGDAHNQPFLIPSPTPPQGILCYDFENRLRRNTALPRP